MEDLQPGIPENAYDWSWTIIVLLFLLAGAIVLFIIYQKRGYILKGFRQTWQRFWAPMPTYFRNWFWVGVTIVVAPEFADAVSALGSWVGLAPDWIKPEWLSNTQWFCGGVIWVAKLAISYRRVDPEKIPDINHPVDAIVKVAPDGSAEVEVLNQPTS